MMGVKWGYIMRELSNFEAALLTRMIAEGGIRMNTLDVETRNVIQRMRKDLFVSYERHQTPENPSDCALYVFAAPLGEDALALFEKQANQERRTKYKEEYDALQIKKDKRDTFYHDLLIAVIGGVIAALFSNMSKLIDLLNITLQWPWNK